MPQNQTTVTYFIIKGISDLPELQMPIFIFFLLIYLTAVGGNISILLLVCSEPKLQIPMYFFLCNLSMMDLFSTTITQQKVLIAYILGDNTIPFMGCMAQMYIFLTITCDEFLILTAMSYDRYVAICNPLHYPMVMNRRVCLLLATVCWMLGFLDASPYLWLLSNFSCYRSNEINHYFCDIVPLMKLTCNDTSILEVYTVIAGFTVIGLIPSLLTVTSYGFIINTVLRIRTNAGRRKAFYTCYSHLTVVILLYTSLFSQYTKPTSEDNSNTKKLLSLFNTAAVPVLNPLIYSLKNKDVKSAVRRRLQCFKAIF